MFLGPYTVGSMMRASATTHFSSEHMTGFKSMETIISADVMTNSENRSWFGSVRRDRPLRRPGIRKAADRP